MTSTRHEDAKTVYSVVLGALDGVVDNQHGGARLDLATVEGLEDLQLFVTKC